METFLNLEFKYKRQAKICGSKVKASKFEKLYSKLVTIKENTEVYKLMKAIKRKLKI